MTENKAEILTVKQLLNHNISIPEYQRPYKWTTKNISELLYDIENAIKYSAIYGESFRYRLGTVILHNDNNCCKVVDGQQRIISLTLLSLCLNDKCECDFLDNSLFTDSITKFNIKKNYDYINDFLVSKEPNFKEKLITCLEEILEVVVITVNIEAEAFQLFDSQNTRGKALDPHDLLKAFHLREMKDYPYEMRHAVEKWEAVEPDDIKKIYSKYLFPIYNWTRNVKTIPFTVEQIDMYKGVLSTSPYNYARRAAKASPFFQIGEPFVAGNDFFEMTAHYLELHKDVEHEILLSEEFKDISEIIKNPPKKSTGFGYAVELFFCALFCYYDKFRNFDRRAVIKLFVWAMMIRIDMQNLSFETINNYAIGSNNEKYSNHISVFSLIKCARFHNEIANLQITISNSNSSGDWNSLFDQIYNLYSGGLI